MESLVYDITLLEQCVIGITADIKVLEGKKPQDFILITKKMKDKTKAEKLLEKKIKERDIEDCKQKGVVSDPEFKKKQDEFIRKDKTYSVIRNSYTTSDDN